MSESSEGYDSPEYNASFLFLLDVARAFNRMSVARETNNYQQLLRVLENSALMLSGYFQEYADINITEDEIMERIRKLSKQFDSLLEEYDRTQEFRISEGVKFDFYKIERDLRKVWKASGLQMKFNANMDGFGIGNI